MTDTATESLWRLEEEFLAEMIERQKQVQVTKHAEQRMFERGVSNDDVMFALVNGRIFESFKPNEYPRGDMPFQNRHHVRSLKVVIEGRTLVVATGLRKSGRTIDVYVITVYWK